MQQIKYQIIPITEDYINLLEHMRFNAYQIDTNDFNPTTSFHANELRKGKYLVFGCFINNHLVGACYISKAHNSLYIEQLFIQKEYQNSTLHLGTNLLNHILTNKHIAEKHFNTKFNYSYLDNAKNTTNFYKNLGYIESNTIMKKRL